MVRTPIIPKQVAYAVTAPTKFDLSPDPTIKGKDGAVRWYREVMGPEQCRRGHSYQGNQ